MQTAAKVSMIALAAMGVPVNAASSNADARAAQLVRQMTQEEKLSLVTSDMPLMMGKNRPAEAVIGAGYVAGVPRLGIPPLRETDASLGVANLMNLRRDDVATALPSTLSLASSWNPVLAHEAGAMIGAEARAKRFNVMLAGGVNLVREPRGGRSFEYPSEDPLLAGTIVGAQVAGIQSNGIISTIKHFAFNSQETGRSVVNAVIDEPSARESDLLAFQIALERGRPGSVMSAYNKVNGDWASENDWLLNQVLKHDWGFAGWVMSDWGNVHSTAKAALAGLDQQSGKGLDSKPFFGKPLADAVASGEVPPARLDDMARRVVRSSIAAGLLDRSDVSEVQPIDYDANARVAQKAAEQGVVLLKNEGDLLPLARSVRTIVVIGGHADVGVLSGGGSTQVRPVGGPALELRPDHPGPASAFARQTYVRSSPLQALQARFPDARVTFVDGSDPAAASGAAAAADIAIVFAEEWRTEAEDRQSLSLPGRQDELIAAVTGANPRTVVVLETGGAVLMPWADKVGAILEAWYPGQRGGQALAALLAGDTAPSGRLPITFPAGEDQLPRPKLDGVTQVDAAIRDSSGKPNYGLLNNVPTFDADYRIEGAKVGYKWFAAKGLKPLFPFGYGLTYTSFGYDGLKARGGTAPSVSIQVTNTGKVAGVAVPQFYAHVRVRGETVTRLVGWQRIELKPGERRTVNIAIDPRLLASYNPELPGWEIAKGTVALVVGEHAGDVKAEQTLALSARRLKP